MSSSRESPMLTCKLAPPPATQGGLTTNLPPIHHPEAFASASLVETTSTIWHYRNRTCYQGLMRPMLYQCAKCQSVFVRCFLGFLSRCFLRVLCPTTAQNPEETPPPTESSTAGAGELSVGVQVFPG